MIDLAKLQLEKEGIFIEKLSKNFILIKGLNNQKFWKLKRLLPEKITATTMGLWFGDGDKIRSIGISNTNFTLVEKFLEFTDILNISRTNFLVEIKVQKENQIDKAEISEKLRIPS
jgi:hypothetical protein